MYSIAFSCNIIVQKLQTKEKVSERSLETNRLPIHNWVASRSKKLIFVQNKTTNNYSSFLIVLYPKNALFLYIMYMQLFVV